MLARRIFPAGLAVISALACSSSLRTSQSPEPVRRSRPEPVRTSPAPRAVNRQSTAARLESLDTFPLRGSAGSGYQVHRQAGSARLRVAEASSVTRPGELDRVSAHPRQEAGSCPSGG